MGVPQHRLRRALESLAIAALVAACAQPFPSPPPSPMPSPSQPSPSSALTLSVENRTTIAVTLIVNGQIVTDVAAGVIDDPVPVALPRPPWNVEVHSPSGHTLLTLDVTPRNLGGATGGTERIRLACGFLTVWAGSQLEGPFGVPASPPACR